MLLPSLEIPAIAELALVDAWVCWRAQMRNGKPTKVPFTPGGSPASSTDPRTWSSYREVFAAAFVEGRHDGIGRVITGDGIIGIDLDKCSAPPPGISSYAEASPSGTGLHVWCRGSWPVDGSKRGGIEVYRRKRFFTATGAHLSGTPGTINAVDLEPLWQAHFAKHHGGGVTTSVQELWERLGLPKEPPDPIDVGQIARRCPQLKRILAANYPSQSERDLALVRFAHMAGRSAADAWALMRSVRTDGKAERPDYALRTIARVFAS
jgi:primase-polymerase (primpol)-like protein